MSIAKQPLTKAEIRETIVRKLSETNPELKFKSFNNRRYIFELPFKNNIKRQIILKVNITKGNINVTYYTRSTLDKTTFNEYSNIYYNSFLQNSDREKFKFQINSQESLIHAVTQIDAQNYMPFFDKHVQEILISRQGIKLGMNFKIQQGKDPFNLGNHLFNGFELYRSKNEQLKSMFINLFNELDFINSGLPERRIRYLILHIIQAVLTRKGIHIAYKVR